MEFSHWFRLAVIALMFIGSTWVLLPTFLQADPSSELQSRINDVDTTTTGGGSLDRYEYVLEVEAGDPGTLADALEKRLIAAGLKIDDVLVKDGRVVVRRALTVTDSALAAQLAPAPVISLHDMPITWSATDALSLLEVMARPDVLAFSGTSAAGEALPTAIAGLDGGAARLSAPFPREAVTDRALPALVAVDGVFQGVVVPDPAPAGSPPGPVDMGRFAPFVGGYDLAPALRAVPLPGSLRPVVAQSGPKTDVVAPAVVDTVPAWLRAILPDTRMLLGLDLQGGIDLTLQVELDEALLAQATRDLQYLLSRNEEMLKAADGTGVAIDGSRRNRFEPILELRAAAGSNALQSLIGATLRGDYEYLDTVVDEGGEWHRFSLSTVRASEIETQAVEQVADVIRRRVAETKVRDPVVVKKGGGKISVQLPGFADSRAAISAVGKSAVLEFKLVDPQFRQVLTRELIAKARDALPADVFANDKLLNDWLHDEKLLNPDREILFQYEVETDKETGIATKVRGAAFPVVAATVLGGSDVSGADVQFDSRTGQPAVGLEFKPAGAAVFCEFTSTHVEDRFAIVLDGEVKSAPSINERICGGRAQITMGNTINATTEAQALAVVLRTGSLNAPVSIGSARVIGPTLGAEAIRAATISTLLGGLLVVCYMLLWYRIPGAIANVALLLNVLVAMATLALFGWTLTLPGIAGIALTVGMAVDANIVIYERIREELKMGQNPRKAVEAGFKKAASAVLDANITTAIAGIVLFSYGDVTIQGFAVTLLVGIATTLLTALYVSRSLMEILTRRGTARLRV